MKTAIFIILISLIVCALTYGVTASHIKEENYLSSIRHSAVLLQALDQNKTMKVKMVLANEIGGLYYNIAKSDDPQQFVSVCKYLHSDVMEISDKYMGGSEVMRTYQKEHDLEDILALRKVGKKRLEDICQQSK